MTNSPKKKSCRVAVLGSTGSIGTGTLDVLRHLNEVDSEFDWQLTSVSGHNNLDKLAEIASEFSDSLRTIVVSGEFGSGEILPKISPGQNVAVSIGASHLADIASDESIDVVVAAIVGRAGLESTLAAIDAGKRVALANKETLVVAGSLARNRLEKSGGEILPVDSEHSAIFQCIAAQPCSVKKADFDG